MTLVVNLNWPTDLFAQANSTAPLLKPIPPTNERICPCGCGMPHNMACSALEGEHGSRRVVWLRSMTCKTRYFEGQKRFDVA